MKKKMVEKNVFFSLSSFFFDTVTVVHLMLFYFLHASSFFFQRLHFRIHQSNEISSGEEEEEKNEFDSTNMQCLAIYSMPSILMCTPNTFDVFKEKKTTMFFCVCWLTIFLQRSRFVCTPTYTNHVFNS